MNSKSQRKSFSTRWFFSAGKSHFHEINQTVWTIIFLGVGLVALVGMFASSSDVSRLGFAWCYIVLMASIIGIRREFAGIVFTRAFLLCLLGLATIAYGVFH